MNFAASPYAKTESQRFDPMTTRGMVTSPHYLATQAGVDILRKGGTALDAAVAVAAVLAVVYPQMCGLGGDNFWLAHEAATGALHGINACGRSGENVTRDFFAQKGLASIPLRGPLSHRLSVSCRTIMIMMVVPAIISVLMMIGFSQR